MGQGANFCRQGTAPFQKSLAGALAMYWTNKSNSDLLGPVNANKLFDEGRVNGTYNSYSKLTYSGLNWRPTWSR